MIPVPVSLGRVTISRPSHRAWLPLLLTGGHRSLAWIRKHPVLFEAPVAALLVEQAGPGIAGTQGARRAALTALALALVLPLLWRRRAPFLVFWVVFGAALGQALISPELNDDLALLISFYMVAAWEPPRRVLAAAAALECGGALFVIMHESPGSKVSMWVGFSLCFAATAMLGYYARDRAARVERERRQEADHAAAAERARVAREMHDIVAHNIAVMIALADGAAYTIAQNPERAAALMSHASETGRSALTEMRRLLGILRQPGAAASGNAPQPALADLGTMIDTVREAGLAVRLTVSGQPSSLPPSAQLALYRIVQEALTNTLKHADATSAHVRLRYRDGDVDLEVTDDGRRGGTAAPVWPGAGSMAAGHGLAGMRERAAVFGGEVSAGPRPEGGWRVHTLLRVRLAHAGTGQGAGTDGT
jgi:signal transduction histidine kinase